MSIFRNPFRIAKKLDHKLLEKRREGIKGYKAKVDLERIVSEKFADFLTRNFGTVWFLIFNAILFAFWIPVNLGMISGIPIFDPYPFGFLTTAVSLEAIFLAVIVLISQNREASIADLREEIDLQINTLAEQKITKIISMVDEIHDHLGLPSEDDEELIRMKQKDDINQIEQDLINERKNNKI